jgi:hypothetical protein
MKLQSIGLCLFATATAAFAASSPSSAPVMPFSFVENRGQAESAIRYIGNGPQFKAWFYESSVSLQQGSAVTRIRFEGGSGSPRIEAGDRLGATANYLRGRDPKSWQTGLPLFSSIRYRGVWPGIEIRFKAEDARTKAEYEVGVGASVDEIRLRFEGNAEIQSDGSLVVSNETGEFREDKPFLFQGEGANRAEVAGAFRKYADGSIGFSVPAYDRTKPLVIDPIMLFSGYFGGSSQSTITGVAVNSYYNTIVAGWTIGTDLPASSGVKPHNAGGVDAFVAGFSPAGGALLFCTYLGGSGDDRAFGVAVDASNNTYVTGQTSSTNFPVVGGVQNKLKGARDAFVAKLNPAGNALVYSTYLGGTGVDLGNAIVVDPSNNSAVIIGDTNSTNMPVTAGTFQAALGGGQDAFVAKLGADGATITWLTYFGGSAAEHGAALRQDSLGAVFVVGSTSSVDFPNLQGSQPYLGGGQDGFVAKLASNGKSIIFSTYLGGSGGTAGAPEVVNAVSLASHGSLMVAGTTSSADFPVTPPVWQATFGGGQTDGFICRLDPDTGIMTRATFVGGSGDDSITAMATDPYNNLFWITGYTSSTDFISWHAAQPGTGGGMDAFIARLGFSGLVYASYLGGTGSDSANAIAIDYMTNIVLAGSTSSSNFPVKNNVGRNQAAAVTSFVTRLAPNFTLSVANPPAFYFDVWHDTGYNGPNITLNTTNFGAAGDIPLIGDWDGSGVKRIGVFRNGLWILDMNGNNVLDLADKAIAFGKGGDIPVLGDWNGTGRMKLGLFRQGTFILDLSGHLSGTPSGLSDITIPFGLPGDLPVVADWSGSGVTRVGVFRSGQWLIDFAGTQSINKTYTYGQAGDIPVVGDWISSGLANQIGVYRHGSWILNVTGNNSMAPAGQQELTFGFGSAGYAPIVY